VRRQRPAQQQAGLTVFDRATNLQNLTGVAILENEAAHHLRITRTARYNRPNLQLSPGVIRPFTRSTRVHLRWLVATAILLLSATSSIAADWSPEAAARYLDGRQKEWFAWKPAQSADGPCVSCHTGMTYLLARPVLRKALNEKEPTLYEKGLLDRLRANVGNKPAGALQSVEAIFAAMFLSSDDERETMSAHRQKAFEQLWTLQNNTGAWRWYAAGLDPWENPESVYYGASVAAAALGTAPAAYRNDAATRDRVAALTKYLSAPPTPARLHDRLAMLWASSTLPSLLTADARRALIADTLAKQNADGGWSLEALGPWMAHPDAPVHQGSDAYATAFTAFALHTGGVRANDQGMKKAIAWLKSKQDPATGAWPAESMNKKRPPDSMEGRFMSDAATAFASIVLIEAR
jgi:squalene-hopene/tetraprenyl-beta-curcumene cyclase